ncbi:unnamed protein product [Lasius platythorax]|uniref:Uncharacterized protein n=1 Tax=Lasius platythorax TaxID=488582 RepID=A0AAV2NWI5_9HYME
MSRPLRSEDYIGRNIDLRKTSCPHRENGDFSCQPAELPLSRRGLSSVIRTRSLLMLSWTVTGTRGIVSYAAAVGLAQFSRPENGLSGIRGGILGTGRLQHRQILNVGCVPTKFKTEARCGKTTIE